MDLWYPNATLDILGNAGPYSGGPYKGVLHTTEAYAYSAARAAYVANHSNPHFTTSYETGSCRVFQHAPINVASLSLKNLAGGVETNRDSVVQIEISGKAVDADKFPKHYLDGIRDLMRWIESQTGIQRIAPEFKPYPSSYGTNGVRFSNTKWDGFNGWCGHMHVPENDHGDPGAIDIGYLLSSAGPVVLPIPEGLKVEDFSVFIRGDASPTVYLMSNRPRVPSLMPVGTEGTLSALYFAGYGKSSMPAGWGKIEKGTTNVPVYVVGQAFVNDLLAGAKA